MRGGSIYVALLATGVYSLTSPRSQTLIRAQNDNPGPSASRWPSGLHLAVDYYPSQWPEADWETDIAQMRANNISYVRINEFDWGILEPLEGQYNFTLLDKSLELIEKYGLKAILGTPTASPPNWVNENYDVDFVDRTNTTLRFGSRRSYSFSSFDYRKLSQTITQKLAERYGKHPVVVGWQLDNEFGCHDTVRSYDQNAVKRFRLWLEKKYGTIDNLNTRQGRVFWSAQYESFEVVQPPFLQIYTLNELHTLDWYTFSSDMVIEFAKEQVDIIRQYAPDQAITHNFMLAFTDFDHHKFARETGIDFATFDQYALSGARTFASWLSDQVLSDTLRTGLPDWQALHHSLYRGIAGAAYNKTTGPWGVMEMQPGMLNWVTYRVSPWVGMVKLWTLEVFASSGSLVNYFRWRQVPYAQEQALSGLHTSDYEPDAGLQEVQDLVREELPILRESITAEETQADVALIYDYTSVWVWAIEPYSGAWNVKQAGYTDTLVNYLDLVYLFHSGLRRLGLSIDVIGPDQPLDGYKLIVVPSMPIIPDAFNAALAAHPDIPVVFGPHSAAKDANFATVPGLNPGPGALRERLPMRVTRVETPPSFAGSGVAYAGANYSIDGREEWLVCSRAGAASDATVAYTSPHRPGAPAACRAQGAHYLGFKPPVEFLVAYLGDVAAEAGVVDLLGRRPGKGTDLGDALRLLRRDGVVWAFNYGVKTVPKPDWVGAKLLIGDDREIPGAGVVAWKI